MLQYRLYFIEHRKLKHHGESQKGTAMLALSQMQTLSQGLHISMTLSQQCALSVHLTRTGSPSDPKENIRKVLESAVGQIKNDRVRSAITEFISQQPRLPELLINDRKVLAVATPTRIRKFGSEYVFTTNTEDGKFIHALGDDGKRLLNPPLTRAVHFNDAFLDPEKFKERVDKYLALIKGLAENVHSLDEYREMLTAQSIVNDIRPQIETVCTVLQFLFQQKNEQCEMILETYLRDTVILESLDLLLSERLLKRFITRFKRAGKRSIAVDFEEMILNTIAEFTLLSMGVISPDIFELKRISQDTEIFKSVKADCKEIGVDIESLMKRFMIRSGNVILYNCYATKNIRSCSATEDVVRKFITHTVRKDREQVLRIIDYPAFFAELKKSRADSDEDDFAESASNKLTELLLGQVFQEQYGILLRKWYPKLECLL